MARYTCVGYNFFESKKEKTYQVGHFVGDSNRTDFEGQEAFNCFVDPSFLLTVGQVYNISWYDRRSYKIDTIEEA